MERRSSPAVDLTSNAMTPIQALIMDFGSEHFLAEQLVRILSSSVDPSFAITRAREEDCDIASANGSLSAKMDGDAAALLFFAFEHFPTDQIVASLLETSRRTGNGSVSIVVIQEGSPRQLAHLFDLGATDVWQVPLRAAEVLGRLAHWVNPVAPPEHHHAAQILKANAGLEHFVGESAALLAEIQKIPVIAHSNLAVLIRGETGTGKDICARAIHFSSPRSGQPFVAVNAGALPQELVENELFGHESGAFTGANRTATGLLEHANGGTLFLDEIDCMPLTAQVKLLRFLQDKQYRPLGSRKVHTADLRIIAASNADLPASVRTGRFRGDLYYRLGVVELILPPLRQRGRDIGLLARHFLKRYAVELNKPIPVLTPAALGKLAAHDWPGNVRELESVIARAVLFAPDNAISPDHIDLPRGEPTGAGASFKMLKAEAIRAFEATYVTRMMLEHDGNIAKAAVAAGQQRTAFSRLVRKHRLSVA